MNIPWEKLEYAIGIGVGILVVVLLIVGTGGSAATWWRYLHVLSGVMWIGFLWYFNFVQIPSMPKIPDEQKPAVTKVIAPAVLFWFRWSALATVVTGLVLGQVKYGLDKLLMFQGGSASLTALGIGMWLALVMAFNVWFIIWPNQQRALGLVEADADTKKKSGRMAMLTSRFNTMLSVPMLFGMIAGANLG
ncbi:MAG: hypothetical protein FJX46_13815 [Alphaproteobacteria bacterium]|nr:hypothetical protein [Alphaproteobacteria bacterium]